MPSAFPDRFILENKRVDKQAKIDILEHQKIIKQTLHGNGKISNLKETENDVRKMREIIAEQLNCDGDSISGNFL